MVQRTPKVQISISLFGVKAEAEGVNGIAALLAIVALLFAGRWIGLL